MVARGRPQPALRRERFELVASVGVIALRHLALQLKNLPTFGHLHEDALHAESAELVRDRFICHAATLTQLLSRGCERVNCQRQTLAPDEEHQLAY